MTPSSGPRERLLDATVVSLRRHGVHGTGIAEVLHESGAARQSIYQHFPGGKRELVTVATRLAGDFMMARSADDPHEHIDGMVDWWIGQLQRSDFALGCPVAAAALAGSDSPEIVAAAAEVFDEWAVGIAERLTAAGADATAATSLSRFQISAVEGAILTSRALRSVEPMEDLRYHLHQLTRSVLPH